MHTTVFCDLNGDRAPGIDADGYYLALPTGPSFQDAIKIRLAGHVDKVQRQLTLALEAIADLEGFTAPETIIAADLGEDHVGHQFRFRVYSFSDGVDQWSEWHDLVDVDPSQFGNTIQLYVAPGRFTEVPEGDAVQFRRRLSIGEINAHAAEAKAVA